jgi:general stress protein YciG
MLRDFLISALFMAGFYFFGNRMDKRSAETRKRLMREQEEARLSSDDYVISEIANFEKAIVAEFRLPDSVCYSDAYVFRFLMKPWFYELVARERYNVDRAKKLRNDMLVYMDLLSSSQTQGFLAMEGKESEREANARAASEEREKFKCIERAFAELVGGNAKKDLDFARGKGKSGKFSQDGTPAPEGYHYSGLYLYPDRKSQI